MLTNVVPPPNNIIVLSRWWTNFPLFREFWGWDLLLSYGLSKLHRLRCLPSFVWYSYSMQISKKHKTKTWTKKKEKPPETTKENSKRRHKQQTSVDDSKRPIARHRSKIHAQRQSQYSSSHSKQPRSPTSREQPNCGNPNRDRHTMCPEIHKNPHRQCSSVSNPPRQISTRHRWTRAVLFPPWPPPPPPPHSTGIYQLRRM